MIKSHDDLKDCLKTEKAKYKNIHMLWLIFPVEEQDFIWKYQWILRHTEYYKNTGRHIMAALFNIWHKRISVKYGIHLPVNTCGKGLKIMHTGPILINGKATIGENVSLHINTAMIVQIYIEIGTLLKQWIQKAREANNVSKESVILMAVYIILGCISMMCYPGKAMDVHTNAYHNIALLLCMVIIGVSALFLSFSRLSVRNRILSFIGQNTLVFYMLNPYAVKILNIISIKAGVIVPKNLLGFLVETTCVCLICATFSILINKGCPWILGKKYNYK